MTLRFPCHEVDEFQLEDAEARQNADPESFVLPPLEVRSSLPIGSLAKLIFAIQFDEERGGYSYKVERMWVVVKEVHDGHYMGWLANKPKTVAQNHDEYIVPWAEIPFCARHIADANPSDDEWLRENVPTVPSRNWNHKVMK